MAMSSGEIRQAIKQTLEVAPAIMRASEIVDAAEVAERAMGDMEQRKRVIEKEIASLHAVLSARQGEIAAVGEDLERAKQDAQAEKAKLNKALGVVQGKVDQAQSALVVTQAEHAAFLKSIADETNIKRTELEGLKREMDTLLAKLRS